MEEGGSPRDVKSWLKSKLNNTIRRTDATSPLLHRRHPDSPNPGDSPRPVSVCPTADGSYNHGFRPSSSSSSSHATTTTTTNNSNNANRVRRSNTTGASPRSASAAASRRRRVQETSGSASPSQWKHHNFAGDLFVAEEGLQRIRNFSTKDGSLVNRGDSFRIKRTARTSANAAGDVDAKHDSSKESHSDRDGGLAGDKREYIRYEILVLGSSGVGKATLINQMMTSVHLAADDSYGQHMSDCTSEVVVKIDQFEMVLMFLNSSDALQRRNESSTTTASNTSDGYAQQQQQHPDLELIKNNQSVASGFLVVYSVTDQSSFRHAQTCLHELRPDKRMNLVILVANKNDLVRNRVITEEDGMKLATRKQCKYIDLSALLDHKVDDLLVGIARQIHMRQLPPPQHHHHHHQRQQQHKAQREHQHAQQQQPVTSSHKLHRHRIYFDEDGNPLSPDNDDDDDYDNDRDCNDYNDDDVGAYENRAHAAALEASAALGSPRASRKIPPFLKPLFGQGRPKFSPGKFQSRVGNLVLSLFKRKHKGAGDKSLSAAFSGHTYAMTSLFPAAMAPLKNRCDDLMSP